MRNLLCIALLAFSSVAMAQDAAKQQESTIQPSPMARVDINRASQATLELLPLIGPVKAKLIIAGRPYKTTAELLKVKGIKGKIFARIESLVIVEVD